MITKDTLDRLKCAHGNDCDCGVLYLHPRCHIKADMEVFYDKSDGGLHVVCGECHKPVVVVEVAS